MTDLIRRWLRRVLGIHSPSGLMRGAVADAFHVGLDAGIEHANAEDFRDRAHVWFAGGDRAEALAARRLARLIRIGESPAFDQIRRSARAAFGL